MAQGSGHRAQGKKVGDPATCTLHLAPFIFQNLRFFYTFVLKLLSFVFIK
jgi:hypothetical protein